jgi:hypothetical protein
MDVNRNELQGVEWTEMLYDAYQWLVLVNTVINLRVP